MADFTIDGVRQERTMFGMIRHTHQTSPQHTVVAYSDNASIMEGNAVERFVARMDAGTAPAYAKVGWRSPRAHEGRDAQPSHGDLAFLPARPRAPVARSATRAPRAVAPSPRRV
jgi:phosphoribosylformylglycinamidine synthase